MEPVSPRRDDPIVREFEAMFSALRERLERHVAQVAGGAAAVTIATLVLARLFGRDVTLANVWLSLGIVLAYALEWTVIRRLGYADWVRYLASTRREYTAIGDTVNTAFRIEGLTKVLGRPIVVSRAVRDALGREAQDLAPLGTHPVKGREASIDLFGAPLPAAVAATAAESPAR